MELTKEQVRKLFDYKPDTGQLIWKHRKNLYGRAGKPAGNIDNYSYKPLYAGTDHHDGYLVVGHAGKQYRVHRLIWIWHHGSIPEGMMVNHEDRKKLNNKIENLTLVTHRENSLNQSLTPRNKSGYAGINIRNRRKDGTTSYEAVVNHEGTQHYLGQWKTFEEAFAARFAAEKVLGFHPNHCKSKKLEANPHMEK